MANTTNFNWETPDDTDLVKDGAAAIRTLGSAIDTSLVDLKGGTTGQVLSKATNTDMDFTWVAQDDSNAIQNAIVDAKGDIITATAADTPARLAVGANDTVLTADSSTATGLKWAASASGGMTLLSTTTLSGATTTISVAGGYNTIVGLIYGCTNNTGFGDFYMAPNGSTNLSYGAAVARYPSTSYLQGFSAGYWILSAGYSLSHTSANNAFQFQIDNYTSASNYKTISSRGVYTNNDSALQAVNIQGGFASNTAITSLVFSNSGGNHSAGTVLIYGVK